MNKVSLRIVIVNFNTSDALEKCIESIIKSNIENIDLQLRIVDNNSSDNSLEFIKEYDFNQIDFQLIKNNSNLGFGRACNQGASNFNGKFILFLNPDCFLNNDVLIKTLNYFESVVSENVGIIGIKLLDEQLNVTTSFANFPNNLSLITSILKLDKLFPSQFNPILVAPTVNNTIEVDQIMGSFFLVKNDLFLKLAGFDETFFMYYEEVDFSLRVRKLGLKSKYYPFVHAIHIGGKSSNNFIAERLFYNLKSRWQYWLKHMDLFSLIVYIFIFIMELFIRLFVALLTFNFKSLKNTILSYILLIKS